LDRAELAINKSAEGARAVLLDPNQQTISTGGFVVREWLRVEILDYSGATFNSVDGGQAD
jgi:hypothetical protein